MGEFVHLRVHSDYSLSEGASKIEEIVATAKDLGVPALALVDKNNLFGALDFSKRASAAGIQPIVGCQLYMEYERGRYGSFSLLAKDEDGYRSLCAVLRAAHDPRPGEDGQPTVPAFPVVTPEALEAHSEGVILLTGGGRDGLLPQLVARAPDMAVQMHQWLLSVFGDRLYVEICRSGPPDEAEIAIEDALIDLAYGAAGPVLCADGVERSEAPLVATSDIWYAHEERHQAWLLLQAVEAKSTITMNGDRIVEGDDGRYHMRSAEEMTALFADLPEAVANTVNIAKRCAFMVKGRKPVLPPFACEGGRSETEELRHQAREGLAMRLAKAGIAGEAAEPYKTRLEYELDVIDNMGFPGYFLIVADFIKWAKNQDIPVGPGRGSGAGSVVAWSLTITDLDPLEFGLLFERFLNPERVSMPDFDIDFCQDRREEVIQYVQRRYGRELVSMIATFGEIKSKTALKDAGRVIIHEQHGTFGFGDINDLTKLIPENPADQRPLKETYEEVAEFRERIDSSPKLRVLFDRARSIEGLFRQVGAHAAGVIIGDRPLHQLVPVTWDANTGMPVCSFNMKAAETAGMVKFDFLGLTTLSVLKEALTHVRSFRGIDIDLSAIPRDDPAVYERFAEGATTGVFQFEGAGMRKVLRAVKPTRLEDLIAVNALFRPGPMDYIGLYGERKNGTVEVEYPQPAEKTRPFLEETYGIMVYQEQVMQVAQACAGYSLGGADLLRRAMGKKIPAEMEMQRKIFIHGDPESNTPGAVALGMDAKVASNLFDDIAKFAGYGFNKSHAAAYAWIAYQTMWLKVHYPVEFFSALMSYNTEKPEKLALIKDELDELDIPLLPPDANASYARFRPEATARGHDGHAVRFGLTAIKQISGSLGAFVEERETNGPFSSLEDFHRRAGAHFNKAQMERLAEAGAFDALSASRRQAASVLGWLAGRKDKTPANQGDLFGSAVAITVPAKVLDVPEWGDIADREFKAVGFYFSRHPIDPYVPRLMAAGVRRRQSFFQFMVTKQRANLEDRKLCVMVDDVKLRQTKRGTSYVEATVSERGDSYRISCYENWRHGFEIEDFRRVLEGAKACRTPVVFLASLALDRSGEGVWVNGREVWAVDDFLVGVRGDIVITMDATHVRLNRDEAQQVQVAEQAVADGRMAPMALAAERVRVRDAALARKVGEVQDFLAKMARNDDQEAVAVRLVTPQGERILPGRYRFSITVESVLKTMDGIVSIQETVARDPGASQPQSARPLSMAS